MLKKILISALCFVGFQGFSADKLVFGSIPEGSRSDQLIKYKSLMAHLEKELGTQIELYNVTDYTSLVLAMKSKKIDFAYFGPKSYIDAANMADARAVAIETDPAGNPGYHGIIIVKDDSPYNSVADLKGKSFAFTDPSSTSGTLVPKVYFKKEGIDPQTYFSKIFFSGSHTSSAKTLLLGKVDAVSTNDIDFDRGVEAGLWKKDEVKVVWTSDLIPGSPYAVRGDLPQELQTKIQNALTSFNDPEELKKLSIGGIIKADDKTFDALREVVNSSKK